MFRKNYFSFLLAVALILAGGLSVFAQIAPVRGKVELKKADGTTEPVIGALIEVFRTDVKAKLTSNKTDKKGNFSFAGFTLGQTFALSVSAPNIRPEVFPNIQGGMENVNLTVSPGDGQRLTEEEARRIIAAPVGNTTASATADVAPAKSGKESAEEKKIREDREKQIADINARNEKIKNSDAIIKRTQEEGGKAFAEKNWDLAIAKYEEGYQASPDFVGSAPILLNNKAAAYTERGVALHNQNVKLTDATQKVANKTKIKQDFAGAIDAYNKSLAMTKNATSTEVPAQKITEVKLQTLRGAENVLQYMVKTDSVDEKATESARLLAQEYIAAETDAAKKIKVQILLGDVFRSVGDAENAVVEYRKALEISPENPDALAGLGLSLFNAGYLDNNNKAKMQEGLNYMTRFAEIAPATHPLKASVADAVEVLKTQEKLAPQKVARPAGRKKQ